MKRRDFLKALGITTVAVATPDKVVAAIEKPKSESEKALQEIHERLNNGHSNFYHWARSGKYDDVYLRIPNLQSKDTLEWMKDEKAEHIHVCNPEKVLKAYKAEIKEDLAFNSGYITDGVCGNCRRKFDLPKLDG